MYRIKLKEDIYKEYILFEKEIQIEQLLKVIINANVSYKDFESVDGYEIINHYPKVNNVEIQDVKFNFKQDSTLGFIVFNQDTLWKSY